MKLMEAAHGSRRSHDGPDAHLVSRVPTHSASVGPVQGFVVPSFLRKVPKKNQNRTVCIHHTSILRRVIHAVERRGVESNVLSSL